MRNATETGVLIVGASQAGVQLATSLREYGYEAPIHLVGGEEHLPYQRPPLSKGFLQHSVGPSSLALRGSDFYRDQSIDLVTGEWIESVELRTTSTKSEATTRSGRTFRFDRLALTVGGTARRLQLPGSELSGVHYLRDIDDATNLRYELESAEKVVVLGGGFIGLEAASAATAIGKSVTVVEQAPRLLARTVAPAMSDFLAAAHSRRGMQVVLNTAVTSLLGTDRVTAVRLDGGIEIDADLVIVGVGLLPRTHLAESLGLHCDNGIVVDPLGHTSDPRVVAAGDCTVTRLPDSRLRRLESVQSAIAQARAAAAGLAGVSPPVAQVPWFWSDQADLKLQMAGDTAEHDLTTVRGNPASESFSVLYHQGTQLVAIDSVNAPRDYMAVRKLLETGGNVNPAEAADTSVPLKQHLKRDPAPASLAG